MHSLNVATFFSTAALCASVGTACAPLEPLPEPRDSYPTPPISALSLMALTEPMGVGACDTVFLPSGKMDEAMFGVCSDMRSGAQNSWRESIESRLPLGKSWKNFIDGEVPWYLFVKYEESRSTRCNGHNYIPVVCESIVRSGAFFLSFDAPRKDEEEADAFEWSARFVLFDFEVGGVELVNNTTEEPSSDVTSLSRVLSAPGQTIRDSHDLILEGSVRLFMDEIPQGLPYGFGSQADAFQEEPEGYKGYGCVSQEKNPNFLAPKEHGDCRTAAAHDAIRAKLATAISLAKDLAGPSNQADGTYTTFLAERFYHYPGR